MKCAAIYGECRCRCIGFGSKIGKGYWKTGTKKARREIDIQSFDCRKNTTLNAGALANELAGLAELPSLKEIEQLTITEALKRANGNQATAAQLLGMTRQALNNRIARSRKSADDA